MRRLFKPIGAVSIVALTLAAVAESSAQTSGLPNQALCVNALNRERSAWSQSSTFSEDIAEAKRRRFTVDTCRHVIESALHAPAPTSNSSARQSRCTGPFFNPVIQTHAKRILATVKNRHSRDLGSDGVFKMFANDLNGDLFRVADALPSDLGANSWAIYSQLQQQIRTADLKTWLDCFPGLEQLMHDAAQEKVDAEMEKARAGAEARKPINRLLLAYKRYAYVKYCNEVRQGYVVVYVNDIELERARTAVKAIEDDALREDATLDTNASWNRAGNEIGGLSVNRDQCQTELNALLQQNPRHEPIRKDF
jgi:hypothetical protein